MQYGYADNKCCMENTVCGIPLILPHKVQYIRDHAELGFSSHPKTGVGWYWQFLLAIIAKR